LVLARERALPSTIPPGVVELMEAISLKEARVIYSKALP